MRILLNPSELDWPSLVKRPAIKASDMEAFLENVFKKVQTGGDTALLALAKEFDGLTGSDFLLNVSGDEAAKKLDKDLRQAIDQAYQNILKFHLSTIPGLNRKIETQPGVVCWQEVRPIEKIGIYVPGGSAPLISTMLMLGIPAQIAGCSQVVVCTPAKNKDEINDAIRYGAAKCGITQIFCLGGAQSIAAMAIGTSSIPKVDKIFGPGNQYVTAAKEYAVKYGVAIDMPAGPSEVLVMADASARAEYVAADLLSQLEHGPDSQAVLVTNSAAVAARVKRELLQQMSDLPRRKIIEQSLRQSFAIVLNSLEDMFKFTNYYAPEHLILNIAEAENKARKVRNAGSTFVGQFTPESAGDYASGTNHTLPTGGWAKSCSGVTVSSFTKTLSFQSISKEGLSGLAKTIESLACAEGLDAHARAVSIRMRKNKYNER